MIYNYFDPDKPKPTTNRLLNMYTQYTAIAGCEFTRVTCGVEAYVELLEENASDLSNLPFEITVVGPELN